MWKEAKVMHIRNLLGLAFGLALVGCTMEDKGLTESNRTTLEPGQLVTLDEGTRDEGTRGAGALYESQDPIDPSAVGTHHHHKRGHNCGHGMWATSDDADHHHHKRGTDCIHNVWATDSVSGHHHHKRGDNCPQHNKWATSDPFQDEWVDQEVTAEAFSDDPSVPHDLSQSDQRSYDEIEAELARQ
jgi:hypothetical protein